MKFIDFLNEQHKRFHEFRMKDPVSYNNADYKTAICISVCLTLIFIAWIIAMIILALNGVISL